MAEVIGTSALKASEGFTRPVPSAIVVAGYGASFFMALTVRTMPLGIVYAVWSGVGIVLISAIGWIAYGQRLDLPALVGLALIVAGVLVVNLLSGTVGNTVKLALASLDGASDVLGVAGLIGAEYAPMRKEYLLDFDALGIRLDNTEALSFGPALANGNRTLVLASDNNFSAAQTT